jgi:ferric-dicitrate binding protein FerR (iron transport regulator)
MQFGPEREKLLMSASTLGEPDFGISLPDGSTVDLNAGSKVRYRTTRSGARMVNLEGEAWFNVIHRKNQPFIINTGDGVINVTGTEFAVRNVPETDRIEVYVESGNVQFYRTRKKDRILNLEAGQMGVLEKNQLREEKNINPNQISWKTRKLRFRDTPLGDVAGVLNRTYNQDILFTSKALEDCLFTGTFDQQPMDSVVRVIQVAFGLKVDREGKSYVLSGDGCN